ncbi:DUF1489 family protein [Acidomonas methanolica]|uniref:Lysophospholipase n=1 Tax=Acidomonas methanolica NBRC 104435 TaxID=1231351 RepID=A0A023D0M7_ACIMT|nr:DUF1489 domain-containing protein [Acidomonas methanolica]MBU2653341.1 DUF1489 domain-containing protein [Acidomonas methanolica]TCS32292.1 hypothetical protein EDC31_101231 [Acidomonas methanolica]GAJ27667.1 hypothetical protein Amme_005_055 [Acidomonas methanolica NBRC 104435]GBQ59232.1 hypothetical protein AA0498_2724 [Acidomonas methanolica]GEK97729.1 lysophospholipase [Acidomonas methanolica NBRC 104435]
MLHLIKLAVGCPTIDSLAQRMREPRLDGHGVITTRTMPKRAEEILAGGSLYRVMDGFILCRQPVADFRTTTRPDGTAGTLILVKDDIIPVSPRAMRPFQGWRYLSPEDAPPDLVSGNGAVDGLEALPVMLRRALAELCLI